MTIILLIRHAEVSTPGDRLLGRNDQVGLSSSGLERAALLARYLSRLPITAVWSSPLRRAIQTAIPIAKKLGLSTNITECLNEVDYGRWTGRSFAELENDPVWRSFNRERSQAHIPDGEKIESVERRVVAQLQKWTEDYPAKTIVAITHAEVIRVAILQSLGIPSDCYDQIEISRGSVTVLDWGGSRPRLICLNESGELACLSSSLT